MRKDKRGLRVKWCENVGQYTQSGMHKLIATVPDGWFIQVWHCKAWRSLMNLRFVREQDAVRAAMALTGAGLDTFTALNKEDGMLVKQIACEALQW